jgi:hypothetical protein
MITLIAEPAKNIKNQNRLVEIFKQLKQENKELEINLKIAKRSDSMRGYKAKDNEILIIFGNTLYKHVLRDIQEFDKMAGNQLREVHKFSYIIRRDKKHYFLACMPPIDFAMSKPDTFLAFESFMKTLMANTQNFKLTVAEVYLNKANSQRTSWPIDVIENGFSPRIKGYLKYDEVKANLYRLFDLPDWSHVAIDIETAGLEIWNKELHDIKVVGSASEDNYGHGSNINLPGLTGCYKNGETAEIVELLGKYIFEKPKIFIAWNIGFEVFSFCNLYNKTYRDFLKCNRVIDGMHLLHVLCENRKIEGYNLKAVSRDLLCFPQYSFIQKYLHYIKNWKTYAPSEIIEAATGSLKYAAEDAAGEYSLTTRIMRELNADPIASKHMNLIAPKVMAVKLETEWNGLTVDCKGMAEGSMAFSGWELDNIVKPTLQKCKDSSDGKLHAEMFVFSTVTGRLLYGKPFLNGMKIGTKASEYFLADPSHTLVYVDLDSADLRSAALVSQDKNLIDDLNAEGDYYEKFAKELFGSHPAQDAAVGERERNIAKDFVLAMLNLAGDKTIAKETGVSIGDVKAYKKKFYERYPKMNVYRNYLENFLNNNYYVFSPSWRMRRFSEDDLSLQHKFKSFLSAHNFPFQATTADLMIVNCFQFIANTRKFNVKQCMLNVDAAIFNVLDEHLEAVKDEFKVFENVDKTLIDGARKFQEVVITEEREANLSIIPPRFKYKLYKGKNLKDMEKW